MEENKDISRDSGVCCLVMVAAYYGIPVNEESIKHSYNLYDRYANDTDILRMAKELKLKAKHMDLPVEKMAEVTLPAIVKMKNSEYAILLKAQEDKLLVAYYNENAPRLLQREEFDSLYSGEVILLVPRKYQDRELKFGIKWFIPTIIKS